MQPYHISLNRIEELQVLNDRDELEKIFNRAKSTIVQGEIVILQRTNPDSTTSDIDELSTEADLEKYKERVTQYVK